jgi:hypothetical protein
VIQSYPQLKNIPVIIGESDPEGCAACGMATNRKMHIETAPCIQVMKQLLLHGIMNWQNNMILI